MHRRPIIGHPHQPAPASLRSNNGRILRNGFDVAQSVGLILRPYDQTTDGYCIVLSPHSPPKRIPFTSVASHTPRLARALTFPATIPYNHTADRLESHFFCLDEALRKD
ncbi:hypothetical protein L6R29_20140 [Myxococcota bacterium]|nr:hypothetical protein [Myxococcota bacterium]